MSVRDVSILREFLRLELEQSLGFTFESGELRGPIRSAPPKGCVWIEKGNEGQTADVERVTVGVRAFLTAPEGQRAPTEPVDPEPLEQLAERLVEAIADREADQTAGVWYYRSLSWEISTRFYGVEVAISAWRPSAYA